MRNDGLRGPPVRVETNSAVVAGKPKVDNVVIDGTFALDGTVTVQADYFGGHEGKSRIEWYSAAVDAEPEGTVACAAADAYERLEKKPSARTHTVSLEDCGRCRTSTDRRGCLSEEQQAWSDAQADRILAAPLRYLTDIEVGNSLAQCFAGNHVTKSRHFWLSIF